MNENKKKTSSNSSSQNEAENDLFSEVYKDALEIKSKSRLWSVIALFLAVVSLSLCILVYWLGMIFGLTSILAILISRRSLGYFDRISVFSLIIAIFGTMFSVLLLIASIIILGNDELEQIFTWIL